MIEINNLTTNPIDEEFLKKVAQIVLEGENKGEIGLSIAFIGSGRMRKLNKKYLGKNRVTDVLAFPQSKLVFEKFKIGQLEKIEGLGEILICPREVKKNARRFKVTFENEMARILIHGILHLFGYNHEISPEKAKEMQKKEDYYLSKIRS